MIAADVHEGSLVDMHTPDGRTITGRFTAFHRGARLTGGPFIHDLRRSSRADTGLRPITTGATVHLATIRPCGCPR